jgi:UDP-N-acetylmuramoyl-tripeptide--D-alanyl-D-alanine ligase
MEDVVSGSGGRIVRSATGGAGRVVTDTRNLRGGDLFIALRGPNHDGHDYAPDALWQGAWGVVVEEQALEGLSPLLSAAPAGAVIAVADTERALGDLAAFHRMSLPVRVVGITGSNGKTTTKEMTAAVAGRRWKVHRNRGNFNNLIGLPLTVLELDAGHQVAVLEMGMNRRGEIRRLAEIGRPEVGVVTNVGPVHLEHIGSVAGVAEAKAELLESLSPSGTAVVNADDPLTDRLLSATKCGKLTFGLDRGADVRAEKVRCEGERTFFSLRSPMGEAEVSLPFPGLHNVRNALAAAAAACVLGAGSEDVRLGLESAQLPPMRFNVMRYRNGVRIINDAYNANPVSMQAALDTMALVAGESRRAAVLGDMLELGEESVEAHRRLGRAAAAARLDLLAAVGSFAVPMAEGAVEGGMKASRVHALSEAGAAAETVKSWIGPNDLLLIKGSRGIKLEDVLSRLKEDGALGEEEK